MTRPKGGDLASRIGPPMRPGAPPLGGAFSFLARGEK